MLFYRWMRQAGVLNAPSSEKILRSTDAAESKIPAASRTGSSRELNRQQARKLLLSITLLVIFTRIFIHFIGCLGYMLMEDKHIPLLESFQYLWNRWDAPHYLYIAENGYVNYGDERNFLVFFPLYPMLIRVFHWIIPNWFWAGVMVSNVSLVIACFYLYKLVALDYGRKTAFHAVKYLLFFPVSFFLGIPFSESLFLALSLMNLYCLRTKRLFCAGIFGMLSALTRSLGILLMVPFIVEYLSVHPILQKIKERKNSAVLQSLGKHFAAVLLIPVGTFLYLCINKAVSGEWFKFLEYQKTHWDQSFGFFAENIKRYLLYSTTYTPSASASLWIPQLVLILCAISLLVYGIYKLRLSYSAYFFVYLLASISPTWLLSGPRYILSAVPVFILLSLLSGKRTWDTVFTYASVTALSFCTLAFVTGHYIM